MNNSGQNSDLRILWAVVLLLAVVTGLAVGARRADSLLPSDSVAFSRLSGIRFAIADFDGDWKPDLAMVETTPLSRVNANYAIRFQFSAGPQASFLIVAPIGGVRVAARDVNGDNLPDLVVSSVLDERVVTILLNHGRGQFSPAEPGALAGFTKEPGVFLHSRDESAGDTCTVASLRYSFGGERVGRAASPNMPATDSVRVAQAVFSSSANPEVCRGRSPPLVLHA